MPVCFFQQENIICYYIQFRVMKMTSVISLAVLRVVKIQLRV